MALASVWGLSQPFVYAQQSAISSNLDGAIEEVVVTGSAIYRDRTESVAPQLEYGTAFFERFEPVSVGDMLKRTPGVAFSSDVGEYDSPQLRGLGNGYTQILINGKTVPSASDDRSFFVDRIPAEIVEKIQIIRSPSADLVGSGIGGAINIILKEGESLNGGSARIGVTNIDGDENKFNASFAYGGQSGALHWSLTGSFQERYVPKLKTEEVFDEELELKEFQNENDVRDSDDVTFGGDVSISLSENSSLGVSLNYIKTDREEDQDETTFEVEDGVRDLDEVAVDDVDIEEETKILGLRFDQELSDTLSFNLYTDLSEVELEENAVVFEGDNFNSLDFNELELIRVVDESTRFGGSVIYGANQSQKYTFGLSGEEKDRSNFLSITDDEGEVDEQAFETSLELISAFAKGEFEINDALSLEVGIRLSSDGRTVTGNGVSSMVSVDYSETHLLPSLHTSYMLENGGTLRASLAQTLRRPGFDQLSPIVLEDEPEDDDVSVGNPRLKDEISTGLDIGYEHPISRRGILGINAFYRDVSDVIESGVIGVSENGGSLYSVRNTGDGKVWGIEVDMSFPLNDRSGFFANASLLDSEITDPFTLRERRFQDQPNYVFNIGLDHTIPSLELSMGFSLQGRGESISVEFGEEVLLEYDPNLEIFIEKRFGNGFIARLTGNNLLDADKIENFTKYDGLSDQRDGIIDEYEREIEKVGPSLGLTIRKSF